MKKYFLMMSIVFISSAVFGQQDATEGMEGAQKKIDRYTPPQISYPKNEKKDEKKTDPAPAPEKKTEKKTDCNTPVCKQQTKDANKTKDALSEGKKRK